MLSHLWNNSRLGRFRAVAWLLFLLTLAFLLALRIPVVLRYNGAVVQLAKNVVSSDSDPNPIHLETEQRQSLVLQFQRLQNQMGEGSMVRYHLGQLAFWSGDYGETINQLKPRPGERSSPLVKLLLGYALWNTGQVDEAVATWRSAPDIRYYLLHQAGKAEYERDYQSAENIYRTTMAVAPGWAAAEAGYWFAHSMNLLQEEEHDPSVMDRAVEQAIRRNPEVFRRQLRLGAELFYQRKLELAKTSLMLAIQLEPSSNWPRYYLGLVYYTEQEYQLAEDKLIETLEIAPDFARGHHWLARTLVQLGRDEEALIHYREALRLLPEDQKLADELKALEARLNKDNGPNQ
jgi:tetratricopeptide (TPR) repeat protein